MAKRNYIPLSERIGDALDVSRARLKRDVAKSVDHVYGEGNKSLPYIAAYERVLTALAKRVTTSKINVATLEKIAVSLERGAPRKTNRAEGSLTKEDYCSRRRAGVSHSDVKADYPTQDIRWMSGYFNGISSKKKK